MFQELARGPTWLERKTVEEDAHRGNRAKQDELEPDSQKTTFPIPSVPLISRWLWASYFSSLNPSIVFRNLKSLKSSSSKFPLCLIPKALHGNFSIVLSVCLCQCWLECLRKKEATKKAQFRTCLSLRLRESSRGTVASGKCCEPPCPELPLSPAGYRSFPSPVGEQGHPRDSSGQVCPLPNRTALFQF